MKILYIDNIYPLIPGDLWHFEGGGKGVEGAVEKERKTGEWVGLSEKHGKFGFIFESL